MIDRRIGPIIIMKSTEADLTPIVVEEGYLVYCTDKKRIFVGDGITKGAISISNKNFVTTESGVPKEAMYGDFVYNPFTNQTFIVGHDTDGITLVLIQVTSDINKARNLQLKINELYNKYSQLSGCVEDPTKREKTCACG